MGTVDREVAVLCTGELTNCLWAEKAQHWESPGEEKEQKKKKKDDVILQRNIHKM